MEKLFGNDFLLENLITFQLHKIMLSEIVPQ